MFESKVPTISKGQKIWNNRRSANRVSIGREKKTQQTNQTNNVLQVCNEVLPPTFVQNNRGSSRASFSKLRVQRMNMSILCRLLLQKSYQKDLPLLVEHHFLSCEC